MILLIFLLFCYQDVEIYILGGADVRGMQEVQRKCAYTEAGRIGKGGGKGIGWMDQEAGVIHGPGLLQYSSFSMVRGPLNGRREHHK